jgi:hypothetical protein
LKYGPGKLAYSESQTDKGLNHSKCIGWKERMEYCQQPLQTVEEPQKSNIIFFKKQLSISKIKNMSSLTKKRVTVLKHVTFKIKIYQCIARHITVKLKTNRDKERNFKIS